MATWMTEAGLTVTTDAATNLIGRTREGERALLSGSHLDTVVNGGWLDGAYGVIAAIEVAQTMHEAQTPLQHPYVVVGFANEEGANGTNPFTGSDTIAGLGGAIDVARQDDDGVTLAERIDGSGGSSSGLAAAAWPPDSVAAMIELHIEQGPVLEHEGIQIGVVDGITARFGLTITIAGKANHAGTTPHHLRQDASVAAAHTILAIQSLALEGHVRVATCGYTRVAPNVRNVVPGLVELGVDIRDANPTRLVEAIEVLTATVAGIGEQTGTTITIERGSSVDGAPCDERLQACVRDSAAALGLTHRIMPSGAGHDAQVIATIAPVGMVFVASIGGTSHHPSEDTTPDDLVAGANVLLHALIRADAAFTEE